MFSLSYLIILSLSLAVCVKAASQNPSKIQWGPCDPSVVQDPLVSCGFLEVPLDYHNPSVGKARLALAKANATNTRLGTVYFNPGGPGGSGLSVLNSSRELLFEYTGGHYDVVGWDPRGVGTQTSPGEIFCYDSIEEPETLFNGTIELTGIEMTGNFTDPDDIHALFSQTQRMQAAYEKVGHLCAERNGDVLKYVGTAATARDIVSIADAIDGPQTAINYVGLSYGTFLGNVLINMFPEASGYMAITRVGRIILDGVVAPNILADSELSLNFFHQLASADDVYKGFFTGCALAGPTGCAIASQGQGPFDVNNVIQALFKAAHDAARADPNVPITSGEIRPQLFNAMRSPSSWSETANVVFPQVLQVVTAESSGSASDLARRAPSKGRRTNIPSSLLRRAGSNDTVQFTTRAIFCGDSIDLQGTTMAEIFDTLIATTRNVSHMFGATWPQSTDYCSFWPVRSVERYSGPFNNKHAGTILVIGNTFDPITPFVGAQIVASALGGTLVQQNGFGHTSIAQPSACTLGITQAYMTNGTLPNGNDTVCEIDDDFEVFPGVNTQAILQNMPPSDF